MIKLANTPQSTESSSKQPSVVKMTREHSETGLTTSEFKVGGWQSACRTANNHLSLPKLDGWGCDVKYESEEGWGIVVNPGEHPSSSNGWISYRSSVHTPLKPIPAFWKPSITHKEEAAASRSYVVALACQDDMTSPWSNGSSGSRLAPTLLPKSYYDGPPESQATKEKVMKKVEARPKEQETKHIGEMQEETERKTEDVKRKDGVKRKDEVKRVEAKVSAQKDKDPKHLEMLKRSQSEEVKRKEGKKGMEERKDGLKEVLEELEHLMSEVQANEEPVNEE
ncbi:hypothetical protein BDQ17DRAFT_1428072 [Cyathus striatus]|nr:hypothetical protein BDQ17DRAFT_1428072 [Cyathus striatus]